MAYLGRQPLVGNYQVLDALTATTTDTYALTKASVAVFPQTPSNCIVSLNGVIQAPVSSYTISGSNIVFASALTGSDSIDFITVLGDVLNIGTPSDGTVSLAKLSATGTKDATTFLRGDNTFASAGGGTNTPAFHAYLSANQTGVTSNTTTKITINATLVDTNSAFASNKFTVPSGGAGTYYLYAGLRGYVSAVSRLNTNYVKIYKNGLLLIESGSNYDGNFPYDVVNNTSITTTLAENDYIELYGRTEDSTGANVTFKGLSTNSTFLGGFKIVE